MRETILIDALPMTWVHTLVIGSGASGLNAAIQLRELGVEDVLIVTEGLHLGTSINTGSDKQTYYKLSMYGDEADSPVMMAQSYLSGGSMHGDLALVEASVSPRAFMHLVNLGVPFPYDAWGQYVGYKTDHDPRRRATSIGPYTSREMCRTLIRQVRELGIAVREQRNVVQLLTVDEAGERRIVGAIAMTDQGDLEAYGAENVVFAVGGPGGLYKMSVYPPVHTGAIGLALMAGATAQNLPESQYGLASTKFRWNVSGTYMQVIPRFVSVQSHHEDDCVDIEQGREFMRDYFESAGEMNSRIFLKGYQWPFDARKVIGGSSLIDILVYVETVLKGRRVFLDFRHNGQGFSFDDLSEEARGYLVRSEALLDTPIARLRKMNPAAIELYADHGIDITREPLEIAVCAQHNNGGLAGNHWWESLNVKHLFPIGEVNGSHGVLRPGGAALNSGQVAGFRVAAFIARQYSGWSLSEQAVRQAALEAIAAIQGWVARCTEDKTSWQVERQEFQERMTRVGAHIRSLETLPDAIEKAWEQFERIDRSGCAYEGTTGLLEALRNRHLCFAHAVYLEAILFAQNSAVGSRGSAVVLDSGGLKIHDSLGDQWRIAPENESFREKVLETTVTAARQVYNEWIARRPIPDADAWFETTWARFRSGGIFEDCSS